jgi:hypothetical protein
MSAMASYDRNDSHTRVVAGLIPATPRFQALRQNDPRFEAQTRIIGMARTSPAMTASRSVST